MEKRYDPVSQSNSDWRLSRDEEFQIEGVWDVFNETTGTGCKVSFPEESASLISRCLPTAARMIPRADKLTHEPKAMQPHSAPINIPDWSKIYGKSLSKSPSNASSLDHDVDVNDDKDVGGNSDEEEDHGDDYDGNEDMLPPHEWLARKLARNQISSFSVFEGVGRTLKGRDLSRVRNAVLTRTGFI
ncbi:hypothetical protein Nepgr_007589 [Nepenthes gracilis]|uniref:Senescence regulator n=1 Tax=Nepenthes gracilis TaxID=150966 RepID=A0AAD3S7H6_NEPGR|nr:hypothetical protein Nepgr_007589 [Nepenthes gracilis]